MEFNKENAAMIPYFAHEGEMNRMERTNRRLWIVVLVLIVCLVGSNAGWLYYESQFETETVTESYEAKADGNSNAVINGEGQVNIGVGYGEVHENSAETGKSE